MSDSSPETVYALVGEQFFAELVERFYEGVAGDAVLRPLYPSQDFTDAKARLCGFLVQYWGGPADYSAARGHPRLRMRHAPFVIGPAQRDAWLAQMTTVVDETVENHGYPPALAQIFHDYFGNAATHLLNSDT
ncbi:MAG TPA: globin [Acidimicrobiales bacterium]|nr:globin [Acidimicrobiales bacterium]